MSPTDADRFAAAYAALRSRESWAERDRVRRAGAIDGAVALLRRELGGDAKIVDVGAGATHERGVIAVDLLPGADVRADMRALPFADGSLDGVLFAASLHYAPVAIATAEAARVLRAGGMLVALDSPIYENQAAAAAAKARSDAYYATAGFPGLAGHYHPIALVALRDALAANAFEPTRLSTGSRWRRVLRRGPSSFVAARKLR